MAEIIRQIKQKSAEGFSDEIYLGAYPQYVGALRQSNARNLEEQYILGVDCITTDSGGAMKIPMPNGDFASRHIRKDFHDGTKTGDFYRLDIYIYDEESNFKIDNQNLILGDGLYSVQDEILFYINNESKAIPISTKTTIRTENSLTGEITIKEIIKQEAIN